MKPKLLSPIRSLADLHQWAKINPRYAALAVIAARNLGYGSGRPTLGGALRWLDLNALETDEGGVVEEVNFCRDLVPALRGGSYAA